MMDQELRCRCSSGAQCQYHQNTFQTTVPLHKYAKNELNCWRDDRRSGLVNVSNDGVAWEFARWWMGSNININAQGITKFIAWDQQWSEELQDRWWSDQQILGTLHICRRHQDLRWTLRIAYPLLSLLDEKKFCEMATLPTCILRCFYSFISASIPLFPTLLQSSFFFHPNILLWLLYTVLYFQLYTYHSVYENC